MELQKSLLDPKNDTNTDLYFELATNIQTLDDVTWDDPISSQIISDDSEVVRNLSKPNKKLFMVNISIIISYVICYGFIYIIYIIKW